MKTTFTALGHFYAAVNVVGVTSKIDGGIWRRKKPHGSEKQDVVIVSLPIGSDDNVQEGVVIVNCFCRNYEDGTPNETKLKDIAGAVIAAIESYASATEYFGIDYITENTMQDPDNERMSYSSIRVNYYIER